MDWECGGRDKATCERLIERLTRWRTRLYCADDYAVYGVLLPDGQLYTGKDETHGIERDNARQRHWLARFRRRSIVVSKAKRMVDVSIALFARFAENNRIADPMIASEASEQGDADVHHPLSLRDHDRAPPKPRQPMSLAGVVPLNAMRLVFARIELSNWQEHVIHRIVIRTVEPGAPTLQPLDAVLAGGLLTTAARVSVADVGGAPGGCDADPAGP